MTLYAPYGGPDVPSFHKVELPAESPQPFGCGGLEADEDAPAAGPRRQGQKFLVIGEVDGDLSHPFFFQVCPNHGMEKVFSACDMLGARADEVVVHHQDTLLPDRLEFPYDITDRSLPVVGPVERRHAAKAAVQRTATGGLNRSEGIAGGQEIVTGGGNGVCLRVAAVIPLLQTPLLGVFQYLRPDALGPVSYTHLTLPTN